MDIVSPWFKLGYVIPHLTTGMDSYQFYRVAPDGMMLVTTQLNLAEYSRTAAEAELDTLWNRVDVLAGAQVDRISVSGVPIASVLGRPKTLELLDGIAQRSGLPADTDLEAHIAACHHLGVDKLAVGTRWPTEVGELLRTYLAEADIEVVSCLDESRNLAQNKVADPRADHDLALRLGREAVRAAPEAQALLLPGGLWFAIHAARQLEEELGLPVLLNITSTVWSALATTPDGLSMPAGADVSRLWRASR